MVIQAPTSSGKTFIGEMAAVRAALNRKKAVYLVPLKALAEEKYRDFTEKYGSYGIRVIVSSRDFREFDADLEKGDFSIAIVVYEKMAQLFARRPERFEEVTLVIVDELEMLADEKRGQTLELLLTATHRSISNAR
jgi:helicase